MGNAKKEEKRNVLSKIIIVLLLLALMISLFIIKINKDHYGGRISELEGKLAIASIPETGDSDCDSDCTECEGELSSLREKYTELESKYGDATFQIEDLKSANSSLAGKNSDLKNSLTTLQDEIDKANKENDNLSDQISERESEMDGLESEISNLHSENDDLKEDISTLSSDNNDLKNTIDELNSDKEKLSNDVIELTAKNKELNDELSELRESYSVFYTDENNNVIYSEKVKKGGDVKNAPIVPEKANFNGEWSNDGKNIQGNLIITPVYYHLLTFVPEKLNGIDVASLSAYTYKIFEDDTLYFNFDNPHYSASILIGDSSIMTADITSDAKELFDNAHFSYWKASIGDQNLKYSDYDDEEYGYASSLFVDQDVTLTLVPNYGCIVKGSKISMSDGSEKNIEDVHAGDEVLTYDYRAGEIMSKKVLAVIPGDPYTGRNLLTVNLENGQSLQIVDIEYLFDTDSKMFIPISPKSYSDAIGKNVMVNDNGEIGSSKIVSIDVAYEYIEHYTMYTAESVNYIANGIVANAPLYFMNERYKIGDDFKVDSDKYAKDVEKYGVYEYEDFADIISRETFDGFVIKDMKFVVERGEITLEELRDGLIVLQEELDIYKNND